MYTGGNDITPDTSPGDGSRKLKGHRNFQGAPGDWHHHHGRATDDIHADTEPSSGSVADYSPRNLSYDEGCGDWKTGTNHPGLDMIGPDVSASTGSSELRAVREFEPDGREGWMDGWMDGRHGTRGWALAFARAYW